MTPLDELFSLISKQLHNRVTPENFRVLLKDINSSRGITTKDTHVILTEILAYLVKIDEKIYPQSTE
jgi:hypothetical protein